MADDNNKQEGSFNFLKDEFVQKYFANTNMLLLSGKHIQDDDFDEYELILNNIDSLKFYYHRLYNLILY